MTNYTVSNNALSDTELTDSLYIAFNIVGTTLHTLSLIKGVGGQSDVYDRLLQGSQIRKQLHEFLNFTDFTLLRLAYQSYLDTTDVYMVAYDLLPDISGIVDHGRLTITHTFAASAILSALRKINLFPPLADNMAISSSAVRKQYHQVFKRYQAASEHKVTIARKRAMVALSQAAE